MTRARGPVVRGGAARFALLGGVVVGHASDEAGATGLTVVRGESAPLRAAAAVVGRATATRELLPLTTNHLVDRVDAVLLTGGSAYGLDAAAGVMRWMEERGRGFPVGAGVVPIVPAAVVFDLLPLGRFDARPTPAMAYEACERAGGDVAEGSVGAGTGATVGKGAGAARAMKGGVGCAVASSSAEDGEGVVHVGALAVVNAFGDVRDASGTIIAGTRAGDAGDAGDASDAGDAGAGPAAFADTARVVAAGVERPARDGGGGESGFGDAVMRNTTLAVVMVNLALTRVELAQVASAATAAFHRRISPAGTSFDGDVVFALSPLGARADAAGMSSDVGGPPRREVADSAPAGHHPSSAWRTDVPPAALMQVEALAVAALEHAIERAVRLARGREGIPGLGDADVGDEERTTGSTADTIADSTSADAGDRAEGGEEDGGRSHHAQRPGRRQRPHR